MSVSSPTVSPSSPQRASSGSALASPSSPSSSASPLASASSDRSREHWLLKHQQHQRYLHESSVDASWFNHSKHMLVCSWSGRPIYTRYGDDSKLAAYTGVITALIE